jgi:hypothetical protein
MCSWLNVSYLAKFSFAKSLAIIDIGVEFARASLQILGAFQPSYHSYMSRYISGTILLLVNLKYCSPRNFTNPTIDVTTCVPLSYLWRGPHGPRFFPVPFSMMDNFCIRDIRLQITLCTRADKIIGFLFYFYSISILSLLYLYSIYILFLFYFYCVSILFLFNFYSIPILSILFWLYFNYISVLFLCYFYDISMIFLF